MPQETLIWWDPASGQDRWAKVYWYHNNGTRYITRIEYTDIRDEMDHFYNTHMQDIPKIPAMSASEFMRLKKAIEKAYLLSLMYKIWHAADEILKKTNAYRIWISGRTRRSLNSKKDIIDILYKIFE